MQHFRLSDSVRSDEIVSEGGEPIVGFAHVARFHAEEDAQVAGESHHARPPFASRSILRRLAMSSAARGICSEPPMTSRGPPSKWMCI